MTSSPSTDSNAVTTTRPRRYWLSLGGCAFFLLLLIVISPGVGSASGSFGWWDAWRAQLGIEIPAAELVGRPLVDWDNDGVLSEEERTNFIATAKHLGFAQRLPRTLLAIQVGITLALCGATFQVLFRNPLATPYTLGIAGGGSLGALIAIKVGWEVAWLGFSSTTLCALAGGLLVVGCVYLLARGKARLTSNEMLLAGVTMGLFCSAMMMVVTVIANERETFRMIRWMMGSLDTISSLKNVMLLPLVLPAWVVLLGQSRALNQYRLGDELAASRGVRVVALQTVAVLVGTLATAAVVAVCGPIGFVGLVVPHMAVLLFGADCRLRLPAAALLGGAFLVLCDWGAQLAMRGVAWIGGRDVGSATLPIGVITAVVGVPVFLILLATRGRRLSGR